MDYEITGWSVLSHLGVAVLEPRRYRTYLVKKSSYIRHLYKEVD